MALRFLAALAMASTNQRRALSLCGTSLSTGVAIPKKKIEFERDSANAPPPPPPPPFRPRAHWNGPKRPDPLPWDGSARASNMKALGG